MKEATPPPRLLTYFRELDPEATQRPLSFAVIRRLLGYTQPYAFKRNVLLVLVFLRALQMPATAWALAAVLNGPVLRRTGSAHSGVRSVSSRWRSPRPWSSATA